MKRHEQVLITPVNIRTKEGNFLLGYAKCPYCDLTNDVILPAGIDRGFGVIDKVIRCNHANMAVNAGGSDIAVFFIR